MPGFVLNSADRVRVIGEFASPELEATYREKYLVETRLLALVIVASAAMVVLGMHVLDYRLFQPGAETRNLLIVRVIYVILSSIAFWGILTKRFKSDTCLSWWIYSGVGLQIYAGTVWPAGHIQLQVTAYLSVLMCYCIMPLALRFQVLAALSHTAASILVDMWLNPPQDPSLAGGEIFWLAIVNILGLVMSQRNQVRQRLLYIGLKRQLELTAKLGLALSEVRTLRGLFRVCSWCKKVHANNQWQQLETYVRQNSHAEFTHGICPKCLITATGGEVDDCDPESPPTNCDSETTIDDMGDEATCPMI